MVMTALALSPPEHACQEMAVTAGELVPARFRAKARIWRERHHPVSIEKRHSRRVLDRRVEYAPDRDGMAWLSAYLPAGQAAGIWDRTTAAARALQGPEEARTLAQLRADVAATWLLTAGRERTPSGNSEGSEDGALEDGPLGKRCPLRLVVPCKRPAMHFVLLCTGGSRCP